MWCKCVVSCAPFLVAFIVSTCGRWSGFRGCSLLSCRVPCRLPALSLCLWWVALEYAFVSRFKGVFRGFWGADVYLYGLRALRGLWGFCVREWLGGLKACGGFACKISSFLPLLFCFRPALLLGFLPCLLSCSLSCFLGFVAWLLVLVGLLAFFPFRTASGIKRKGAKCFPCVLSCRVMCV